MEILHQLGASRSARVFTTGPKDLACIVPYVCILPNLS